METFVSLLNLSIRRTRALSRLLDPVGRELGGLRPELSQLADRSGVAFDMGCTLNAPDALPKLSSATELRLYRIAQEAIHNAVSHGQAACHWVQTTQA